MLNQRPSTVSMKKRSFYREDEEYDEVRTHSAMGPTATNPRKHKNFHIDLECMRLNAEKERISHYKELAITGAI